MVAGSDARIREVLQFWFDELDHCRWRETDPALDRVIAERFAALHTELAIDVPPRWRASARGTLAAIIVLDQFSRNMFRDSPLAFAHDSLALALAQEAVSLGEDAKLDPVRRPFLYMPYMHSESLKVHDVAVQLFGASGNEGNLEFERQHRDIIAKFGRYPHRNEILGRPSTAEELEFLREPGSSF